MGCCRGNGQVLCFERGHVLRIELLNEPNGGISRGTLAEFYARAIRAARKHLDKNKPIVINEWPFWLFFWKEVKFKYTDYGRIQFSTHMYQFPKTPTIDQQEARDTFNEHFGMVNDFFLGTGYEVLVTEYALNSHGPATEHDAFDYNSLTHWFVHQFNQIAIGSMV